MKALVSINFALEMDDEDDLMLLARTIDESMYESIVKNVRRNSKDWQEFVEEAEGDGLIDWYGVSISLKRGVLDGIQEGGE